MLLTKFSNQRSIHVGPRRGSSPASLKARSHHAWRMCVHPRQWQLDGNSSKIHSQLKFGYSVSNTCLLKNKLYLIFWYMGVGCPYCLHNWMSFIIPLKGAHPRHSIHFSTTRLSYSISSLIFFFDLNFSWLWSVYVLTQRDWCVARVIFRSDKRITNFELLCKKNVFGQHFQQWLRCVYLLKIKIFKF